METRLIGELCRLQGAVEAVTKYLISTPTYEMNVSLILKMLDINNTGKWEKLKDA